MLATSRTNCSVKLRQARSRSVNSGEVGQCGRSRDLVGSERRGAMRPGQLRRVGAEQRGHPQPGQLEQFGIGGVPDLVLQTHEDAVHLGQQRSKGHLHSLTARTNAVISSVA
jgi:hypothetical protein